MKPRLGRTLSALAFCAIAACGDPAPTTGAMIVEITGLPASVLAAVRVTGPAGFQRSVQATTTLEALPPGDYTVSSATLSTPTALYDPVIPTHSVSVVAGQTQMVSFAYALASGSIELTATGLPAGVGPYIAIVGPTYLRTVTSAGLIHGIPPGQYVVRADTFASITGDRFGATLVEQPVTITASETPVPLTVAYGPASGTLNLLVTGLSVSANDAITVTGTGGFVFRTSTSTTMRGLKPGTYTVASRQIVQCPTIFTPTTAEQSFDVALAQVTDAPVSYQSSQPGPETLNLSIEAAYLTQAVQNASATIPIVAGRPALLRVFGIANQCNTATPAVRVRFSNGDSVTIPAPESSVRFASASALLSTSWNALLPAELMQPGLTFEAEIDAGQAVAEADETDNKYPAPGLSTPVIAVPPFDVTFVPITQSGATGNVSEANLPEYLRAVTQMLPLGEIRTAIAPPFTSQYVLGNGSITAFQSILGELDAKRVADAGTSGYAGHYYGVLMPAGGITFVQFGGIAYRPGKTALGITVGWFSNARQATELVAHELSHNLSNRHAPCGAAGGPDPAYPYAGGAIGVTGYDLSTATTVSEISLKVPSTPDIMGYCANPWISDYMYERIINYRMPPVLAGGARMTERASVSALLVSGMVSPDSVRLEPAFQLTTRPELPESDGPYAIEGRSADGTVLFRTAFAGVATDHGDPSVRYFTFAIPMSEASIANLAEVELVGHGRRAGRRSAASTQRLRLLAPDAAADEARVTVTQRTASDIELVWDAAQWPSMLVRDPVTKTLLAIGRGGRAIAATPARSVELLLSDGARSVVVQVPIGGR